MIENVTLSKIRARLGDYLTSGEKGALIAFEKQIAELKDKLKKEEDSCRFYQKTAKQLRDKIKKLDWLWHDWAGKANKYLTELEKLKKRPNHIPAGSDPKEN